MQGLAVVYLILDDLIVETLNGEDGHVQKPFSFLQLHSAIEDALVAREADQPVSWSAPGHPAPWYG